MVQGLQRAPRVWIGLVRCYVDFRLNEALGALGLFGGLWGLSRTLQGLMGLQQDLRNSGLRGAGRKFWLSGTNRV